MPKAKKPLRASTPEAERQIANRELRANISGRKPGKLAASESADPKVLANKVDALTLMEAVSILLAEIASKLPCDPAISSLLAALPAARERLEIEHAALSMREIALVGESPADATRRIYTRAMSPQDVAARAPGSHEKKIERALTGERTMLGERIVKLSAKRRTLGSSAPDADADAGPDADADADVGAAVRRSTLLTYDSAIKRNTALVDALDSSNRRKGRKPGARNLK